MTKDKPDYLFIIITFTLVIFGFTMLASVSSVAGEINFNNPFFYLKNQTLKGLTTGLLLFFIAYNIKIKYLNKFAIIILGGVSILMFAVFLPKIGLTINGATRWLKLNNFTFQPAEFLKIALIIYLSSWLAKHQENIKFFSSGFLSYFILTLFLSIALIFQKDLGSLIILMITASILFFVGKGPIKHFLIMVLLFLFIFGIFIAISPYRKNRILVFFNPEKYIQAQGYHLNQSVIAIGSGGILGLGYGESRQKYQYLPEAVSDSIFAIIGEEFGFVGSFFLIFLYLIYLWRIFYIAKYASSTFESLLSFGLGSLIIVQAFVNITAISGLIPLTGVPLPFISYGGSSLSSMLAISGIISNISKHQAI